MPSSVILRMDYLKDITTLRVTFVSGKVYDYIDVPEEIFMAMKTSRSKGIFFNEHIKGHYSFRKVDETKA